MPSDEELYERAAYELRDGTFRPGLWAQAFAEAEGHRDKADYAFLRLRVTSIKAEHGHAPVRLPLGQSSPPSAVRHPNSKR